MPNPERAPPGYNAAGDPLVGKTVLIIEDEPFLAEEMAELIGALGMIVVGPYPSTRLALAALEGTSVNCGILDINLNGENSFRVADLLVERQVPFLFMSGYSREVLPTRFTSQPMLKKPIMLAELRVFLEAMLA